LQTLCRFPFTPGHRNYCCVLRKLGVPWPNLRGCASTVSFIMNSVSIILIILITVCLFLPIFIYN
jgi:hypothetical protein